MKALERLGLIVGTTLLIAWIFFRIILATIVLLSGAILLVIGFCIDVALLLPLIVWWIFTGIDGMFFKISSIIRKGYLKLVEWVFPFPFDKF